MTCKTLKRAIIVPAIVEQLYTLKWRPTWAAFKQEGAAFWMISLYILMEFVRPQAIYPWIDVFPWTRAFVILAAVLHFFVNSGKPSRDSYNFWLPLFLLLVLISCFTAYDRGAAFKELPEVYSWLVIYFIVSSVVDSEPRLWMFLLLFFLACAKLSVFCAHVWVMRGFSFASWGVSGPPGYFQNSGELSLLMCMFFAMSYTFWQAVKKHLNRVRSIILLILPITAVMTVLASSTRGSQLALLAQVLYLATFYKKLSMRSLIATVVVLCALYYLLPAEQLQRFSTSGTDETSVARLTYWKKGYDMVKHHPFAGVGLGNFPKYFQDFYPEASVFHNREEVAHNTLVQVASELGIPGLIVFLIILLKSFRVTAGARAALKAKGQAGHWLYPFSVGLDCAMIGFLIGGEFMSVAYYPYVWIHISFVVATRGVARTVPALQVDDMPISEQPPGPPLKQQARARRFLGYSRAATPRS